MPSKLLIRFKEEGSSMSLSTKILIFLGFLAFMVLGSVIIYKQFEISARQEAIEKQMVAQKELQDNILRSMSQYATKEQIEDFAKQSNINLEEIKKDLKTLDANVTAINTVVAHSQGQAQTGVPSTGHTPNPTPGTVDPNNPDPFGYAKNRQFLNLNEKFSNVEVPIGQVGFSAWKDKPWDYTIHPRTYQATTVIGTDENQRHYVYNKLSMKVGDKSYDIKLDEAKTLEQYPEAKFSWFNPRIYLGIDAGANLTPPKAEAAPSVNLQLMSYGKYKNQPDLSILQVGVTYQLDSQKVGASVMPVGYNIGKHIPLMNNLYIGPSVHLNTDGNIGIMGGIRVGM